MKNSSQSTLILIEKRLKVFFFSAYYLIVAVYPIYHLLEFLSIQFHFFHLIAFKILIMNFLLIQVRALFFIFYYYYFLLLLKGKEFLIQNKFFFISTSFKSIRQKFYYFFLNSHLKFVSFEFKISNLLLSMSRNKFVLAFIIIIISFILIIKIHYLIKRLFKLKKLFFYLKKHQKL